MGNFARQNRESAAKGYIRALIRSKEPVIINDEAVLHIVLQKLGKNASYERIDRGPPLYLFTNHINSNGNCEVIPPGRITRLILSDRIHGIDPTIVPKLKEDVRNASDKSRKTIMNLTINKWPNECTHWHYFRVSFKVQLVV